MCECQFREMTKASRSKLIEDFTEDDIVDWSRGRYKGIQGDLYYTTSRSKVKKLAAIGNSYAKSFIEKQIAKENFNNGKNEK